MRFVSPLYNVTTAGNEKVTVDVTNSISAGLSANKGLMGSVISWMKQVGCSRVLDFGAGALRHSIPLLRAGFEVVAVEYERAYTRPKCSEFRKQAEKMSSFTALVWPQDFLKCKHRFDVVLLTYVLQVVPVKRDREVILEAIGARFDKNGPKRLYYASRFGEGRTLPPETVHNDGWVKGRGESDRSFYTEWTAAETDAFFKKAGYARAGTYKGPEQPHIYEFEPGVL